MVATEFRLLGEVAAVHDGKDIDLGYARQRCVLAVLLMEANRVVPADALLERVWADHQPRRARNALSGYVSRLRHILAMDGEVQLRRAEGGYRLAVDPLSVDLHRFRGLVAQARAAATDEVALNRFQQALGLWRGEAFATVETPWLNDMRGTFNAERLAAVLDRNDLALRLGQHTDLMTEVAMWVDMYPLDERLAGQFMHALYRCGRQADALRHYELVRSMLADELGADPRPPLRQLHHRILTAAPCLTPDIPVAQDKPARPDRPRTQQPSTLTCVDHARPNGIETDHSAGMVNRPDTDAHRVARDVVLHLPTPVSPPVRNDLPGDVADFAGRRSELARLLTAGEADVRSAVVVYALDGMAGVGKTTLAVRAAHQLAGLYPDAQFVHRATRPFAEPAACHLDDCPGDVAARDWCPKRGDSR